MQVSNIQLGQNLNKDNEGVFHGKLILDDDVKFSTYDKESKITSADKVGESGYGKPEAVKQATAKLMEDNGGMDATQKKNQMAVMAETTSSEDLKEMEKDGESPLSMSGKHVVTVFEKIKAKMAAAGVEVDSYGLSDQALQEVCVSEAQVNSIKMAVSKGSELKNLTDDNIAYMISGELAPTISNIYKAEYATGSIAFASGMGIDGKVSAILTGITSDSRLVGQIENVIMAAGKEINDETMKVAAKLMGYELPVTASNISYYMELENLELPLSREENAELTINAFLAGEAPSDAVLIDSHSLASQAKDGISVIENATDDELAYLISEEKEVNIQNLREAKNLIDTDATIKAVDFADNGKFIRAKRILEETRLLMTEEANISLLKKGIHIDTTELSTLVEDLKVQENNYYKTLLSTDGEEVGADAINLYKETESNLEQLKNVPMYVLNFSEADSDTILSLKNRGQALAATMQQAGQSYETLMTDVRRDLGDNIKDAFRNVDDILSDMGLETSTENQRAVKILGYNSIEINDENISKMKAADELVQRTFKNMTAPVVRELIRQGENPLTMKLSELNDKAMEVKSEITDSQEKYSEYLFKLERNGQITEEEKQSFIGIYRLINQVEKSDGSVIGALIESGKELSFKNLLAELRSEKNGQMEYTIDDSFNGVDGTVRGLSIDQQIQAAYNANVIRDVLESASPETFRQVMEETDIYELTPEELKSQMGEIARNTTDGSENNVAVTGTAEEAIANEEKAYTDYERYITGQRMNQAAEADSEIYSLLERYGITDSVNNVLAMNQLMSNRGQVFKQLFQYEEKFSSDDVDFTAIQSEILEKMSDAMSTPEELAKALNELAERAEHVMDGMIPSAENATYLDIKALQSLNKQLSIASSMAKDETYTIPTLIGDEVTGVTLKLVKGTGKKGLIDILFETERLGKVAISLEAKGNEATGEKELSGIVVSDDRSTLQEIEHSQMFGDNVNLVFSDKLNLNKVLAKISGERIKATEALDVSDSDETTGISTSEMYELAKDILESIKNM